MSHGRAWGVGGAVWRGRRGGAVLRGGACARRGGEAVFDGRLVGGARRGGAGAFYKLVSVVVY